MNIVFDLDDTLYEIVDIFEAAINEEFPQLKSVDINILYEEFRTHSDDLFEFSKGNPENLEIMQKERIKRTVKKYGLVLDDEKSLAFHRNYEQQQFSGSLRQNVKDLLKRLIKEGHTLGMMSNGDSYRQHKKAEALNIKEYVEDRIVISGDYDFAKPDPRLFKVMEEKFNNEDEFIMIGDSFENDIIGALNSNWSAIYINKHDKTVDKDYKIKSIKNVIDLKNEDFEN